MGFAEGFIILDSPNDTYYAGQIIHGKLQFELQKKKSFRGMYIDIQGKAHTHWNETKSRTHNGKTTRYTVSYDGNEDYFDSRQYFVGGSSGEVELNPGSYCYDFEFQLQPTLPSSFVGEYGSIEYKMKVTIDRPWKFDQEKNHVFTVIAPLDLNFDPKHREPIYIQLEDTYCCCWCKSGPMTTEVKIPMCGFVPEQVVPVEVYCQNLSDVEIVKIKLFLIRKTSYYVTSPSKHSKERADELVVIKKGPIPVGTTRSWTIDYKIPESFHNVGQCSLIDIQHFFKVEVCISGCHLNSDDSREVFLGTVALCNQTSDQSIANTEIPINEMMYPYHQPGPIQNMQPASPIITQQSFSGNNVGVVMSPPYPLYPMPTPCILEPTDDGSVPVDKASAGFGWQKNPALALPQGTFNDVSYAYNPNIVPPEKQ